MNKLELTGQVRTHIVQFENPRFAVHSEVASRFLEMCQEAKRDGIEIQAFSSYRDFKTQCRIWNKKFAGEKTLYDRDGVAMDFHSLTPEQLVTAILHWSALPGASRHHWGTEIDVIDASTISDQYRVKLLPEETAEGGVFHRLHCWLDTKMEQFGFYRPYKTYQGGMFPEPWHLSYFPISQNCLELLTFDILQETIKESDILGKNLVLELLPQIYQNHILNVATPPCL